ncbi:hypothetical protein [Dasania marina]|uniref:hypothetical protein n=1 Tax=Dasania marina TaxID=471499 RepID=UPI00037211DB|nr:hypothetical protein [Dasania marina]
MNEFAMINKPIDRLKKIIFSPFSKWILCLLPLSLNAAESNRVFAAGGSWSDGDGGVVVMQKNGQFLEVDGKDNYSIYRATCLLSENASRAQCQGHGVQYKTGRRFLLNSQWQLGDGNITEHWQARFADKTISGELLLKPIANSP